MLVLQPIGQRHRFGRRRGVGVGVAALEQAGGARVLSPRVVGVIAGGAAVPYLVPSCVCRLWGCKLGSGGVTSVANALRGLPPLRVIEYVDISRVPVH